MRFLRSDRARRPAQDLPAPKRAMPAPKRKAPPAPWRGPALKAGAALGLLGLVAGGTTWIVTSGAWDRALAAGHRALVEASLEAGFALRDVYLEGRLETDTPAILDALDVSPGDPILFHDMGAARARLEALGWVKRADIARVLPDRLYVRIQERRAVAIWQRGGRFDLIDADGVVIGADGLRRHRHLKVVVGAGAQTRAADLIALLDAHPALKARVGAAVWIGDRRWNLRLDNGVDVRLPEEAPDAALARLADLDRRHDLLGADIEFIDLRQPDRLVVRQTPEAAERRRAGVGDST